MKKIEINFDNGKTGDAFETIDVIAIKTFPQFGGNREHVSVFVCYANNAYFLDFADKDPEDFDPELFTPEAVEYYATKRILEAVRERGGASEQALYKWAREFGFKVSILLVDHENNAEKWWDNGGRDLWDETTGREYANEITVPTIDAIKFFELAGTVQGWHDGDAHAKFPVLVCCE